MKKKLINFHKQMNLILKKKKAKIDKIYYCPYHPKGNIKIFKKFKFKKTK